MNKEENINLLRKIAWSFHKSTGLEWDDLFSEACWLYCKALKSYTPERGKLSSYAWMLVSSELKDYVKKIYLNKEPLCFIEDLKGDYSISYSYFFESLSRDAQQIAKLVLQTPRKFVVLSSDEACKRVKGVMRARGWSEKRIQVGLSDLIKACSE